MDILASFHASTDSYPFDINHSNTRFDAFDPNGSLHDGCSESDPINKDEVECNARSYLQLGFTIDQAQKQQILELSLTKALFVHSFVFTTSQTKCQTSSERSISLLAVKCSEGVSPFCSPELADLTESSCSEVESEGEGTVVPISKFGSKRNARSSSSTETSKKTKATRRPVWSSTMASKDSRRTLTKSTGRAAEGRARVSSALSASEVFARKQDATVVGKKVRRSSCTFGQVSGNSISKRPPRRRRSSIGTSQVDPQSALAYSTNLRRNNVSSLNASNGLFSFAKRISRKKLGPAAEARTSVQGRENHNLKAHGETRPQRRLTRSASVRMTLTSGQDDDSLPERSHLLGNYLMRTSHGKNRRRSSCNSCGI